VSLADWTEEQVHDFIHGDDLCGDLDCYYCRSPLRPANLRTLARNLATAAALCRAWQLGAGWADDLHAILDPLTFDRHPMFDHDRAWRPGCGTASPTEEP
jgi:hypothetical protein